MQIFLRPLPMGVYWFGLFCAVFLLAQVGYGQIAGTVYRDFNQNGQRETSPTSVTGYAEPGVAGIVVSAFTNAGFSASATTGSTGAFTLPVSNGAYRLEFTNRQSGDFSAIAGAGNRTSVQFVVAPAATVSYGINYPADFCQPNPELITSCYVFGNQTSTTGANGASGADPVLISFPYESSGSRIITVNDFPVSQTTTTIYDIPRAHTLVAVSAQTIGTTFGSAYARNTNLLYASAFFKRHAGFGVGADNVLNNADDPGTIYVIRPGVNQTVNRFVVSNVTTNSHNVNDYNRDNGNVGWDAVGKTSLGGMDLSDDDDTLYVMDLQNRQLVALNPTNGAQLARVSVPLTYSGCPNAADIRPFAVEYYRNRLYVGVVCTGETTRSTGSLRAYMYSLNPANLANFGTPVFDMPLNYPRGKAANTGPANWRPWSITYVNIANSPANDRLVYPMPMFTSIAFDNNDLIVSFRDRMGDIAGNNTFDNPATNILMQGRHAGDILRASGSPQTGWTLESNGQVGGRTSSNPNTGQGPGGGEFYQGDAYPLSATVTGTTTYTVLVNGQVQSFSVRTGASTVQNGSIGDIQGFGENHDEVSMGAVFQLPGYPELTAVVYDPVPDNGAEGFHDGGIRWMNNQTGSWAKSYRIYNGTGDAGTDDFGKQAGLGELVAICGPPPLEIGNRIWNDTDRDGLQDATETSTSGITGLTVQLYLTSGAASTLVATTTTGADGTYYFNDANVPGGLINNRTYEVRLTVPATKLVTTGNAGTSADDDIDSDASLTGIVALTTGLDGQNNHDYDIGLIDCATPSVTLVQGACNFNNTNSVTSDDSFTISVRATSTTPGPSNTYEVVLNASADGTGGTVLNGTGTTYGQPVTLNSSGTGPFRADGITTYTLTIRDLDTKRCRTVRTTTAVESCSSCQNVLCPKVSLRKQ